MPPEKTYQEKLKPTSPRRRAEKKARWGNFDRAAGRIRRTITNSPLLAPLFAAGMGAAALGKGTPAKADEFIIGRNPGGSTGNVWFDVLDYETGTPTSYNQGFPGTVTGILYVPEGGYTLFSVNGWGTLPDAILRRNNGSGNFTVLTTAVTTAKEYDYNPDEGKWSAANQVGNGAMLGENTDPDIRQSYSLPGKQPLWVGFIQNSPTPFAIAVNSPSTISLHNIGGDLDGDGFPDNTTPPQIGTSIDLGAGAYPQAAWYDRANKVLYVACRDTQQIRIYNIDDTSEQTLADTANQTPVIIPLSYKPTDLKPSPNGTQIVVTGNTPAGYPYSTILPVGANASDAENPILNNISIGFHPVPDYQSIAFDSEGSLWIFSIQGGASGVGYATEFDFNLIPTGETRTFGGNQLNVGGIALSPASTYPDNDGDGVPTSLDCDDGDATVSVTSEFLQDSDGDGFGLTGSVQWLCGPDTLSGWTATVDGDCDDGNPAVNPSAPEPSCGGPDLNCDTIPPPTCPGDTDGDGDGFTPNEGDCADGDPTINPNAPEVCGGGSEDCDPEIDESGSLGETTVWPDSDGDGYGAAGVGAQDCPGTPGTVNQDGDCNDGDASIHPNAPEIANGLDNDCDTFPSAALNTPITSSTDNTLLGNPGIPAENGPNILKGLGQSVNVKVTHMVRENDEISGETQDVLAYQTVDSSELGQLRVSREADGVPIIVYQRPDSAAPDYIPTWTAAVTGTVLEVLDQTNGIAHLSVIEGTSVEIETEFYNDQDLWDAYLAANPGASETLTLSGPGQWAEVDKTTGEIMATNVQEIQDFLNFAEEYQSGDDDDSGDDDSGDDDSGDDDTGDDDDETPDDDDETPDDDDETPDDDDATPESDDDDSAGEIPGCKDCQATVLTIGPNGKFILNSQALAWATLGTIAMLRRRRTVRDLKRPRARHLQTRRVPKIF